MRRAFLAGALAAGLVFPAGASAANTISVSQAVGSGSVAVVDAGGTVDTPCSNAECRWQMQVVAGANAADCATSNRVIFISDLLAPGSGTTPFAVRYETPVGPRSESVCLRVFDSNTQGTRVLASFDFPVPASGATFRPTAPASPPASGVAGASAASPALASGFALKSAGAALHRSLKRRYGRRWNVAGSRSVDCNAVSSRSYSCTIRFDGRTLRARVSRLTSGRIGIVYS